MGGIGKLFGATFIIVFDFHSPVGIFGGNFSDDFVAFGFVGSDGYKSVAEFVELALGISLFNSMSVKKIHNIYNNTILAKRLAKSHVVDTDGQIPDIYFGGSILMTKL